MPIYERTAQAFCLTLIQMGSKKEAHQSDWDQLPPFPRLLHVLGEHILRSPKPSDNFFLPAEPVIIYYITLTSSDSPGGNIAVAVG